MVQHCGTIVTMLVPMLSQRRSTKLWQRLFVDAFKHPSNILWTSRQHCVNIAAMLYSDKNPNIATILPQRWLTLATIQTMLKQCSVNVVATSLPIVGANVETMMRQHCVNILETSLPNIRDQH